MTGKELVLKAIERGLKVLIGDKFARSEIFSERDASRRAEELSVIVSALGETLASFQYPVHWKRFLQRKDCPAYMREMTTRKVNVYYPKRSLPEEKSWITIDPPGADS